MSAESLKNNPNNSAIKYRISIFLLILTTLIWGTSFIITKTLIQTIPPNFYMGLRFLIGAIAFIPFYKKLKKINKEMFLSSILLALLYWLSNLTQTIGMQFTTASKSGFITGLNVILVPVFLFIFFHKEVSRVIWIAVVLATIGTGILSLTDGVSGISIGDLLTLACAILYAFYIIYIDRMGKDMDDTAFSFLQLLLVSVFSLITSAIFEDWEAIFTTKASAIFTSINLAIMIYVGVVISSLTFLFQIYGQKNVEPNRTALIFSLEPVFASFFAILWGNEVFNIQMIIGAAFIFIGILLSTRK